MRFSYRLAGAEDKGLPCFDFTTLNAYETCPTWGSVRYGMGLGGDSAQALALGHALHTAFSAIRIAHLFAEGKEEAARSTDKRLFGGKSVLQGWQDGCTREGNALNLAMKALHESGYEEDMADKRRTISNAEVSLICYLDRYDWEKPPLVLENGFIGIEQAFDLVVEMPERHLIRFIGRIDGVHDHGGRIVAIENKTAGRLDEAWRMQWHMSHQVTGYVVATRLLTGIEEVEDAQVQGLAIPQPKHSGDGVVFVDVSRRKDTIEEWETWFERMLQVVDESADPAKALRFTHSCSRYFRPCPLIPYCAGEEQERKALLEMMPHNPWSPLDGG